MMARQIACCAVLGIAALFALLAAAGILRSKNNLAALHCLGVAGVTLPVLALIAVVMVTGFGVSALKTLAFAVVLLVGSPIGSHAIALAERRRKRR